MVATTPQLGHSWEEEEEERSAEAARLWELRMLLIQCTSHLPLNTPLPPH